MKRDTLWTYSAALTTVCTSSGYMESTDDMEHLLFKRVHIAFWELSNLLLSKTHFLQLHAGHTFLQAYNGYITQLALEESKFFFWAHSFDSSYFFKTICIFGILGLADDLVIDLMFFAFTYMTSSSIPSL